MRFFEPPITDVGGYEVTLDPVDSWDYRTPSLRKVALTGPYMHDGSLATLEAVVEFYDGGGIGNPQLDPQLKPLGLSEEEKRRLVVLLHALTGHNVEALAGEARAAQSPDNLADKDPTPELSAQALRPPSVVAGLRSRGGRERR